MTKKRVIPKRGEGKRTIPRRKKKLPEENAAQSELHARDIEPEFCDDPTWDGAEERFAEGPGITDGRGPEVTESEPDLTGAVLKAFVNGKLDSDTLHEQVVDVYKLSSYVEAHKIVLRMRKDKLIVDRGVRLDDVTPVFELA